MEKQNTNEQKSYVASIRTALSGPEDGIARKLPESYASSTVGEVLTYLIDKKQRTQEEGPTARSIEQEMARDYTLAVNGRVVKPADAVASLFEEKTHKGVKYYSLEMEVASVQEGGLDFLLY